MNQWSLSKAEFGPLYQFIEDTKVTDIDWDGDALWVEYTDGRKIKPDIEITKKFVDNFTQYVAHHMASSFNPIENTLSAETDTLRITVAHESLVTSGRCFFIRKSAPVLQFSAIGALKDNYCTEECMHFLVNCVSSNLNCAFVGEPGHGKTECAKFFSSFIREEDKVITIEDALEWHYKYINPGKRADEIRVNENADYVKAIKLALRMNPTWLMLSEARSTEVQYLIEGWSTGVSGMTTLHTDDVRNIADRMINMSGTKHDTQRMTNNIYTLMDVGILLEKEIEEDGTVYRRIKQVGIFYRENGENHCDLVFEDGVFYKDRIPACIKKKMAKRKIVNPTFSPLLKERMDNERAGIFYSMDLKDDIINSEPVKEIKLENIKDETGLVIEEEVLNDIVDIVESM